MPIKHKSTTDILYIIVTIACALILFIAYLKHNVGYAFDDSYITYRYAENFRLGFGLVFNVGERFYGSTATGYAIILGAIARLSDLIGLYWSVPHISTAISGVSVTTIAIICSHVLARNVRRRWKWAFVLSVPITFIALGVLQITSVVSGQETYFYVALLLIATFVVIFHDRMFAATLFLAIATTCRPDVSMLAFILFVVIAVNDVVSGCTIRSCFKKLVPPGLLYLACVLLWVGWTKLYYGAFLPETLKAKEAQTKLGLWRLFDRHNLSVDLTSQFGGTFWLILAAIGATYTAYTIYQWIVTLAKRPAAYETDHTGLLGLATFLYSLGLTVSYLVLHVTIWAWYVTPIGLFLLMSALCFVSAYGLGPSLAAQSLSQASFWKGCVIASGLLCLAGALPPLFAGASSFFGSANVNTALNRYAAMESYLKAQTPSGTTIAMPEPGQFGFDLGPDYRVEDVLGLVTPNVIAAMIVGDYNYVVPHLKPSYVIVSWGGAYEPNGYAGFSEQYRLVGVFNTPYWMSMMKRGALMYVRMGEESPFARANGLTYGTGEGVYAPYAILRRATGLGPARARDPALLQCGKLDYDAMPVGQIQSTVLDSRARLRVAGWAQASGGPAVGAAFLVLSGVDGGRYTARFAFRSMNRSGDGLSIVGASGDAAEFWGTFDDAAVPAGTYHVSYLLFADGAATECAVDSTLIVSK